MPSQSATASRPPPPRESLSSAQQLQPQAQPGLRRSQTRQFARSFRLSSGSRTTHPVASCTNVCPGRSHAGLRTIHNQYAHRASLDYAPAHHYLRCSLLAPRYLESHQHHVKWMSQICREPSKSRPARLKFRASNDQGGNHKTPKQAVATPPAPASQYAHPPPATPSKTDAPPTNKDTSASHAPAPVQISPA